MSTVPSMLGSGMKKMCDWLLRKLVQLICYIGEQYLSELEATGKWKKLSIGNLGSEDEMSEAENNCGRQERAVQGRMGETPALPKPLGQFATVRGPMIRRVTLLTPVDTAFRAWRRGA